MDIGMLWYDDDARRRLDEKVARAVEYYRAKYGIQPTDCFVNPSMLAGDNQPAIAAGVRLRTTSTVLTNHFWLGVGDETAASKARNGSGSAQKRRFTGENS